MGEKASSVRAKPPRRVNRRRRWPRYGAVALVVAALLVFFAPSIVLRSPLRDWLLSSLLPEHASQLQVTSISGGWQTPIEARGVRCASGSVELVVDSVQCHRTLLDLLWDSSDLGCIRLTAPQLTVTTRSLPQTDRGNASGSSRAVSQCESAPTKKRRAIAVELQATDGILYAGNSKNGRTCLARDVDFYLNLPPLGGRATFRMMARTGDPKATAHISAHGTLNWPCHSLQTGLVESHVDLVGVDAELAEHLLATAGLSPRSDEQREGDDTAHFRGCVSGSAEFRAADQKSIDMRANFEVQEFALTDPSTGLELREPTVSISAVARLAGDVLHLDSGRISSDGLNLDVSGVVQDCAGEARAELGGSVLCDWQKLAPLLRQVFSEEIQIVGKERRPWRLTGPLRGNSLHDLAQQLELDAGSHVASLRVCDFDFGPAELAAHWRDGAIQFEPIECSFQSGQVRVQPVICFRQGMPLLHVHEGRVIDQVAIDPKLCDWILRYVDPLGTISRNLQGHLSLEIEELEIPLTRDGLDRGSLSGRLLLDDVQFAPEQSLREILTAAGIAFQRSIRTSQTINIRLRDGRVYHSGLALPIGNDQVTMDGWVALDHTINIRVSLPVTEEMLGKDKRLYRLLRGQRIELPVTGTLENPKVSEESLARNIQRLVQTALRDNLGGDDPLRGLLRRALK